MVHHFATEGLLWLFVCEQVNVELTGTCHAYFSGDVELIPWELSSLPLLYLKLAMLAII